MAYTPSRRSHLNWCRTHLPCSEQQLGRRRRSTIHSHAVLRLSNLWRTVRPAHSARPSLFGSPHARPLAVEPQRRDPRVPPQPQDPPRRSPALPLVRSASHHRRPPTTGRARWQQPSEQPRPRVREVQLQPPSQTVADFTYGGKAITSSERGRVTVPPRGARRRGPPVDPCRSHDGRGSGVRLPSEIKPSAGGRVIGPKRGNRLPVPPLSAVLAPGGVGLLMAPPVVAVPAESHSVVEGRRPPVLVRYFVMEDGRITRPAIGSLPGPGSVEAAATVGAGKTLAFQYRPLLDGGEAAAGIFSHHSPFGKTPWQVKRPWQELHKEAR